MIICNLAQGDFRLYLSLCDSLKIPGANLHNCVITKNKEKENKDLVGTQWDHGKKNILI